MIIIMIIIPQLFHISHIEQLIQRKNTKQDGFLGPLQEHRGNIRKLLQHLIIIIIIIIIVIVIIIIIIIIIIRRRRRRIK